MSLDKKDMRILEELDKNPRMTTSKLGKKIHASQQVIDYRIKRLEQQKIIEDYGTILNLEKIGYRQYRIFVQLGTVTDEQKQSIIEYLKTHPNVYWAALVGSKWDLLVVLFVKDYEELETTLDEIFEKFPKLIKDYDAFYTLYHEFYHHKYLHEKQEDLSPIKLDFTKDGTKISLDKTDICILDQMKQNCRLSSLAMSKPCKVNYKTVQLRIKNLESKGIIAGYRVFLHSEYIGEKAYLILISFSSYAKEAEKKLFAFARKHSMVTQAIKLFGTYSLLLHIRAKDLEAVQNIVIELRNTYPIIGSYEIVPIFSDITINHFPMSKELLST